MVWKNLICLLAIFSWTTAVDPNQLCAQSCSDVKLFYDFAANNDYRYSLKITNKEVKSSGESLISELKGTALISTISSCNFQLKLEYGSLFESIRDRDGSVKSSGTVATEFQKQPVFFGMQNGRVNELCLEMGLNSPTLNMHRSFLSAIQITIPDLLEGNFYIMEQDLMGYCPTKYEVTQSNGKLLVRKEKLLSKCLRRSLPLDQLTKLNLQMQYKFDSVAHDSVVCDLQLDSEKLLLDKASCLQTFGNTSNQMQSLLEIHYLETESKDKLTRNPKIAIRTDLRFEVDTVKIKSQIARLFTGATKSNEDLFQLTCSIATMQNKSAQAFFHLVNYLREIESADKLTESYDNLQKFKCADLNENILSDVFLDALVSAQTATAARFLVTSDSKTKLKPIQRNKFLKKFLITVISSRHAGLDVVDVIANLYDDVEFGTAALLAASSIRGRECQEPAENCNDASILNNLEKACDSKQAEKVVVFARVLGNIGGQTDSSALSEILTKCFANFGTEMKVLLALADVSRRFPCDKISHFSKFHEDLFVKSQFTSVRVRAYLASMRCNSYNVDVYLEELNSGTSQIKSFLISHMKRLLKRSPTFRNLMNFKSRVHYKNLIESQDEKSSIFTSSRYFDTTYKLNPESYLKGKLEVISAFGRQSYIPELLQFNFTLKQKDSYQQLLDVALISENLEKIKEKWQSNSAAEPKTSSLPSWMQTSIAEIDKKSSKITGDPKLTISLKFMDFDMIYNENFLDDLIDGLRLKNIKSLLDDYRSIDVSLKQNFLSESLTTYPTICGFALTNLQTTALTLDMALKFQFSMKESSKNVEFGLKPKFDAETLSRTFIYSYHSELGYSMQTSLTSNLDITAGVQLQKSSPALSSKFKFFVSPITASQHLILVENKEINYLTSANDDRLRFNEELTTEFNQRDFKQTSSCSTQLGMLVPSGKICIIKGSNSNTNDYLWGVKLDSFDGILAQFELDQNEYFANFLPKKVLVRLGRPAKSDTSMLSLDMTINENKNGYTIVTKLPNMPSYSFLFEMVPGEGSSIKGELKSDDKTVGTIKAFYTSSRLRVAVQDDKMDIMVMEMGSQVDNQTKVSLSLKKFFPVEATYICDPYPYSRHAINVQLPNDYLMSSSIGHTYITEESTKKSQFHFMLVWKKAEVVLLDWNSKLNVELNKDLASVSVPQVTGNLFEVDIKHSATGNMANSLKEWSWLSGFTVFVSKDVLVSKFDGVQPFLVEVDLKFKPNKLDLRQFRHLLSIHKPFQNGMNFTYYSSHITRGKSEKTTLSRFEVSYEDVELEERLPVKLPNFVFHALSENIFLEFLLKNFQKVNAEKEFSLDSRLYLNRDLRNPEKLDLDIDSQLKLTGPTKKIFHRLLLARKSNTVQINSDQASNGSVLHEIFYNKNLLLSGRSSYLLANGQHKFLVHLTNPAKIETQYVIMDFRLADESNRDKGPEIRNFTIDVNIGIDAGSKFDLYHEHTSAEINSRVKLLTGDQTYGFDFTSKLLFLQLKLDLIMGQLTQQKPWQVFYLSYQEKAPITNVIDFKISWPVSSNPQSPLKFNVYIQGKGVGSVEMSSVIELDFLALSKNLYFRRTIQGNYTIDSFLFKLNSAETLQMSSKTAKIYNSSLNILFDFNEKMTILLRLEDDALEEYFSLGLWTVDSQLVFSSLKIPTFSSELSLAFGSISDKADLNRGRLWTMLNSTSESNRDHYYAFGFSFKRKGKSLYSYLLNHNFKYDEENDLYSTVNKLVKWKDSEEVEELLSHESIVRLNSLEDFLIKSTFIGRVPTLYQLTLLFKYNLFPEMVFESLIELSQSSKPILVLQKKLFLEETDVRIISYNKFQDYLANISGVVRLTGTMVNLNVQLLNATNQENPYMTLKLEGSQDYGEEPNEQKSYLFLIDVRNRMWKTLSAKLNYNYTTNLDEMFFESGTVLDEVFWVDLKLGFRPSKDEAQTQLTNLVNSEFKIDFNITGATIFATSHKNTLASVLYQKRLKFLKVESFRNLPNKVTENSLRINVDTIKNAWHLSQKSCLLKYLTTGNGECDVVYDLSWNAQPFKMLLKLQMLPYLKPLNLQIDSNMNVDSSESAQISWQFDSQYDNLKNIKSNILIKRLTDQEKEFDWVHEVQSSYLEAGSNKLLLKGKLSANERQFNGEIVSGESKFRVTYLKSIFKLIKLEVSKIDGLETPQKRLFLDVESKIKTGRWYIFHPAIVLIEGDFNSSSNKYEHSNKILLLENYSAELSIEVEREKKEFEYEFTYKNKAQDSELKLELQNDRKDKNVTVTGSVSYRNVFDSSPNGKLTLRESFIDTPNPWSNFEMSVEREIAGANSNSLKFKWNRHSRNVFLHSQVAGTTKLYVNLEFDNSSEYSSKVTINRENPNIKLDLTANYNIHTHTLKLNEKINQFILDSNLFAMLLQKSNKTSFYWLRMDESKQSENFIIRLNLNQKDEFKAELNLAKFGLDLNSLMAYQNANNVISVAIILNDTKILPLLIDAEFLSDFTQEYNLSAKFNWIIRQSQGNHKLELGSSFAFNKARLLYEHWTKMEPTSSQPIDFQLALNLILEEMKANFALKNQKDTLKLDAFCDGRYVISLLTFNARDGKCGILYRNNELEREISSSYEEIAGELKSSLVWNKNRQGYLLLRIGNVSLPNKLDFEILNPILNVNGVYDTNFAKITFSGKANDEEAEAFIRLEYLPNARALEFTSSLSKKIYFRVVDSSFLVSNSLSPEAELILKAVLEYEYDFFILKLSIDKNMWQAKFRFWADTISLELIDSKKNQSLLLFNSTPSGFQFQASDAFNMELEFNDVSVSPYIRFYVTSGLPETYMLTTVDLLKFGGFIVTKSTKFKTTSLAYGVDKNQFFSLSLHTRELKSKKIYSPDLQMKLWEKEPRRMQFDVSWTSTRKSFFGMQTDIEDVKKITNYFNAYSKNVNKKLTRIFLGVLLPHLLVTDLIDLSNVVTTKFIKFKDSLAEMHEENHFYLKTLINMLKKSNSARVKYNEESDLKFDWYKFGSDLANMSPIDYLINRMIDVLEDSAKIESSLDNVAKYYNSNEVTRQSDLRAQTNIYIRDAIKKWLGEINNLATDLVKVDANDQTMILEIKEEFKTMLNTFKNSDIDSLLNSVRNRLEELHSQFNFTSQKLIELVARTKPSITSSENASSIKNTFKYTVQSKRISIEFDKKLMATPSVPSYNYNALIRKSNDYLYNCLDLFWADSETATKDAYLQFNYLNKKYGSLKKIRKIVPPYEKSAHIIDNRYIIQYDSDKTWRMIAGCRYLLARDFRLKRFSIFIDLKENMAETVVMAQIGDNVFEIYGNGLVKSNNEPLILPYVHQNDINNDDLRVVIKRKEKLIRLKHSSFIIELHSEYGSWRFSMQGQATGAVRGLLGWNNYYDDDDLYEPYINIQNNKQFNWLASWATPNCPKIAESTNFSTTIPLINDFKDSFVNKIVNPKPFESYKLLLGEDETGLSEDQLSCRHERAFALAASLENLRYQPSSECYTCGDVSKLENPSAVNIRYIFVAEKNCIFEEGNLDFVKNLAGSLNKEYKSLFSLILFQTMSPSQLFYRGVNWEMDLDEFRQLLVSEEKLKYYFEMRENRSDSDPNSDYKGPIDAVFEALKIPTETTHDRVVLLTCKKCVDTMPQTVASLKSILKSENIPLHFISKQNFSVFFNPQGTVGLDGKNLYRLSGNSNEIKISTKTDDIKPPKDKCTSLVSWETGSAWSLDHIKNAKNGLSTVAKSMHILPSSAVRQCKCTFGQYSSYVECK